MMDDVHINVGINDMIVWGPEYVISDIARALIERGYSFQYSFKEYKGG